MATWSKAELRKIAEADDLHISPFREAGNQLTDDKGMKMQKRTLGRSGLGVSAKGARYSESAQRMINR